MQAVAITLDGWTQMLCPAFLRNMNKHERSLDIVTPHIERVTLSVRALHRDKRESRTCPRLLESK